MGDIIRPRKLVKSLREDLIFLVCRLMCVVEDLITLIDDKSRDKFSILKNQYTQLLICIHDKLNELIKLDIYYSGQWKEISINFENTLEIDIDFLGSIIEQIFNL